MRFMFSIVIMIRANDESKNKSNRSLDNRARERERIRTSKVLIGRTKTWVDRNPDGKPSLNGHAPTVLRVYEDAARGYGAMKIAARLTDEGFATFNGGAHWSPASVLSILRDDAVMGYFQPHRYEKQSDGKIRRVRDGEPVEDYYPRLVPPALVKKAREGLENRKQARGRSSPTWANLVKGLSRCDLCGGKVHYFERRRDYPYLRCYAATGVRACHNRRGFRYDRLEPLLFTLYETYLAVTEILPKAPDESAARLAELEAVSSRVEEGIDALVDDLENTPVGPAKEAVQRRLAQRNAELVKLRQQILEARLTVRASESRVHGDVEVRFAQARSKMNADDPEERRNARREVAAQYQRVIERITLHEDRTLTIQMKPRDGIGAAYRLNHDGLIGAEVSVGEWRAFVEADGKWRLEEPPRPPVIDKVVTQFMDEYAVEWGRMSERQRERALGASGERARNTRVQELVHEYVNGEWHPGLKAALDAVTARFDLRRPGPDSWTRVYLRAAPVAEARS